jgi:arginine decarboxylase
MKIKITKSSGSGSTKLASFDKALYNIGLHNLNLIYLSSVIPAKSVLLQEKSVISSEDYGKKAYVVISSNQTSTVGKTICAGIGWVQEKKSGKGLFVEIQGNNKKEVAKDIDLTLKNMMSYRNLDFMEINMLIEEAICKKDPITVLVVALHKIEGW